MKDGYRYMPRVGERMRNVRKSKGWTLQNAAKHTGLSPAVIGSYERAQRNPTIDQLAVIAEGYGITVASFLPDELSFPQPLTEEEVAEQLHSLHRKVDDLAARINRVLAFSSPIV